MCPTPVDVWQIQGQTQWRCWAIALHSKKVTTVSTFLFSRGPRLQQEPSYCLIWRKSSKFCHKCPIYKKGMVPSCWLPRWLSGTESACNVEDASLIPGSGRSEQMDGQRESLLLYIHTHTHTHIYIFSKKKMLWKGTSLVVQWLRICIPMKGMWVQALVGELKSHMLQGN